MSDHWDKVLEEAEKKHLVQQEQVNHTRRFINQVLEFAGREPRYKIDELSAANKSQLGAVISRNEYFGKPLAFCVRNFLQRRKGPVREATLDEIIAALEQGNYDLRKSGSDRDIQRRGVAISLAKNTKVFHKLPNGDFGLAEWYESIRKVKKSRQTVSDVNGFNFGNRNDDPDFDDGIDDSDFDDGSDDPDFDDGSDDPDFGDGNDDPDFEEEEESPY